MTVDNPTRLWENQAASGTTGRLDTARFSVIAFRVVTTNFTGTLAFQGQLTGDNWMAARYHSYTPNDGAALADAANSAVAFVLDSSERIYYCAGPWAAMELVLTRSGGSITVDWFGSNDPALITAMTGVDSSTSHTSLVDEDGNPLSGANGVSVQQSDADALQVTARLVWGEDGQPVDELNRLPVQGPDIQDIRQAAGEVFNVRARSRTPDPIFFQQGALATGNGLEYDVEGMTGVVVQLAISVTATVTWEVLQQDGSWVSVIAANVATGVCATTATATGAYWVPAAGFRRMRARISSYSSGTVTAYGVAYYGTPLYSIVLMANAMAGEDLITDVVKVEERFTGLIMAADTQVKSSAGFVHSLTFAPNDSAPTAGSFILYDSAAESGTQLFNMAFTTTYFVPFSVILDVNAATGIYAGFTTTADVNVTISYR
jgi:hypothetical protein